MLGGTLNLKRIGESPPIVTGTLRRQRIDIALDELIIGVRVDPFVDRVDFHLRLRDVWSRDGGPYACSAKGFYRQGRTLNYTNAYEHQRGQARGLGSTSWKEPKRSLMIRRHSNSPAFPERLLVGVNLACLGHGHGYAFPGCPSSYVLGRLALFVARVVLHDVVECPCLSRDLRPCLQLKDPIRLYLFFMGRGAKSWYLTSPFGVFPLSYDCGTPDL